MATLYDQHALETQHEDMIHDAQLDYYGKKLATCSSDRSIKIFEIDGENRRLIETLKGHEGPVWQIAWAHPKFGNILASSSYDTKVIIWKEQNGNWSKIKEHSMHTASVNSVAWAPHDFGPILACASSDGKVSVLTFKDDGTWDAHMFEAHGIGANSVSWAPATVPGSLVQVTGGAPNLKQAKRFVSGGCDNLVKIWAYREESNSWTEEESLEGHSDWVRDVAWAPNIGLPKSYLASCSQDKTVLIWTQDNSKSEWNKKSLQPERFPDVVWRVSWSLSGNILAVACGDNKISLWKENPRGDWEI
ncbi:3075_t:CDS:2 [Ambispora leptoticha]|uniref:3075_t:CDS:1 n=1 Tax=Ambispora leptoticha TaxID=144679 RepID=A0A9N8W2U8_9GLOM|nr:3075_t:CDS:2 [Ambispora leptoticha]